MSKSSRHSHYKREDDSKKPRLRSSQDRYKSDEHPKKRRRDRSGSFERSHRRRRSRSPNRRSRSPRDNRRREVRGPPSRWEEPEGLRRCTNSPQRLQAPQEVPSGPSETTEAPNGGRNLQRNLQTSGVLNEEFSTYKGVVIKYNEPQEAAMPEVRWRVYVFKPGCDPEKLYIHRQSAYLVSRDRKIADIPFDHPSISKQHAVLQYRKTSAGVTLYLMDLESANGTLLNGVKVDPRRYYEIMQKDVVKFGFSSRECVFLTEDALDAE